MSNIENKHIENHNTLITRATYAAMSVAIVLSIVKFLNYHLTGSVAIHGSALDSLLDIAVSVANYIAIKVTQRKPNRRFPYGYDKIAPLVALLQVILVAFLAGYLLLECWCKLQGHHELHDFGYGVAIIVFSLVLNTVLVMYQTMVVKKTGSLVIKADMLHYKTDFFTNLAILLGLIFVHLFDIYWLDPVVGALSAVYLISAICVLTKSSVSALLDMNDTKHAQRIINHLNENGFKFDHDTCYCFFSGTQMKLSLTVDSSQADASNLKKLESLLNGKYSFDIKVK